MCNVSLSAQCFGFTACNFTVLAEFHRLFSTFSRHSKVLFSAKKKFMKEHWSMEHLAAKEQGISLRSWGKADYQTCIYQFARNTTVSRHDRH